MWNQFITRHFYDKRRPEAIGFGIRKFINGYYLWFWKQPKHKSLQVILCINGKQIFNVSSYGR